jgi:hypothetical protein
MPTFDLDQCNVAKVSPQLAAFDRVAQEHRRSDGSEICGTTDPSDPE